MSMETINEVLKDDNDELSQIETQKLKDLANQPLLKDTLLSQL
ncbi:MAG: hypothetical protein ACOZBL_04875 [Patescibacteria group bacterium]